MPKGIPKGIVRRALSMQHEKFAVVYATTSDRRAAYEAAGGKSKGNGFYITTGRWLNREDVKRKIASVQKRIEDQAISNAAINRGWVESNLVEVINRCMQKEAVFDHDGVPTGEWRFESASALRGLELAGKTLAMFTDKLISEDLDRALTGKTPEQVEGVMKALIAEIGPTTIRRYLAETEHTPESAEAEPHESGRAGEDAVGVPPEEAGALPPVSEAGGVPPGRLLQ